MDLKIQQVKRDQEVDEDSVAKRRKTDVEQSQEDRRYPKKKVALLLAYSGKGYYGMQVQTPAAPFGVLTFLSAAALKSVLCGRGTLDLQSSGPSRTTWWPRSSSLAASLKTMQRT